MTAVSGESEHSSRAGHLAPCVPARSARSCRNHKRLFFIAVAGAAVAAACAVLSAEIVGRIADDLVRPRFVEGSVEIGAVIAVLGSLILVGVVRSVGVVIRRTWAGPHRVAHRRVAHVRRGRSRRHPAHPVAAPPEHGRRRSPVRVSTPRRPPQCSQPLPFATSVVVMLVLSAIWLVLTDPVLGLAAVAGVPVAHRTQPGVPAPRSTGTSPRRSKRSASSARRCTRASRRVNVVKAFGAERRETERLAVIAVEVARGTVQHGAAAQHVRGAARRRAERGQHRAARRRRVSRAVGRPHGRRAHQLHLPVHAAGVPAAPHRLRAQRAAALAGRLEPPARAARRTDRARPDGERCCATTSNAVELRDVHVTHDGERDVLQGVDCAHRCRAHRRRRRRHRRRQDHAGAHHRRAGAHPARHDHRPATGVVRARRSRRRRPRWCSRSRSCSPGRVRQNVTLGVPIDDDAVRTGAGDRRGERSSTSCPTVSTRSSASAASACRAASASASPWPERWCVGRRCCCSTTPPRRSTRRPRRGCSPTSGPRSPTPRSSRWPRARPPSRWPTRCCTSSTVSSSRTARHDELMASSDHYRELMQAFEHDRAELDAVSRRDRRWRVTEPMSRWTAVETIGRGVRRGTGAEDRPRAHARRWRWWAHSAGWPCRSWCSRRSTAASTTARCRSTSITVLAGIGAGRGDHRDDLPAHGGRPARLPQRGGAVRPARAVVRAHPPAQHRRPR